MLPIITYSAKITSSSSYIDGEEIYGGTYTPNNAISIDVRIWNNKFGIADVDSLKNFSLNFYFGDYEDSALLKYLKIVYNGNVELPVEVRDNVATVTFFNDVEIKGTANNGEDTDTNNYLDVTVVFDPGSDNIKLKEQDVKSLFVEIVTQ